MVEIFDHVGVEPVLFGPAASRFEHRTLAFRGADALFVRFEVGRPCDVARAASDQADDLLVECVDGLANVRDVFAVLGTLHARDTERTRVSSALMGASTSALRAR